MESREEKRMAEHPATPIQTPRKRVSPNSLSPEEKENHEKRLRISRNRRYDEKHELRQVRIPIDCVQKWEKAEYYWGVEGGELIRKLLEFVPDFRHRPSGAVQDDDAAAATNDDHQNSKVSDAASDGEEAEDDDDDADNQDNNVQSLKAVSKFIYFDLESISRLIGLFEPKCHCGSELQFDIKLTTTFGFKTKLVFTCRAEVEGQVEHNFSLDSLQDGGSFTRRFVMSVLASGGQHSKWRRFSLMMSLPFVCKSQFYTVQADHVAPALEILRENERKQFLEQNPSAAFYGAVDSTHSQVCNADFNVTTLMLAKTKKGDRPYVYTVLVHRTDPKNPSRQAVKSDDIGLRRVLTWLTESGLRLLSLSTDDCKSVAQIVKDFLNIIEELLRDCWHKGRKLKKKILACLAALLAEYLSEPEIFTRKWYFILRVYLPATIEPSGFKIIRLTKEDLEKLPATTCHLIAKNLHLSHKATRREEVISLLIGDRPFLEIEASMKETPSRSTSSSSNSSDSKERVKAEKQTRKQERAKVEAEAKPIVELLSPHFHASASDCNGQVLAFRDMLLNSISHFAGQHAKCKGNCTPSSATYLLSEHLPSEPRPTAEAASVSLDQKKRTECKCGSKTHIRSSSKDCPFNKNNSSSTSSIKLTDSTSLLTVIPETLDIPTSNEPSPPHSSPGQLHPRLTHIVCFAALFLTFTSKTPGTNMDLETLKFYVWDIATSMCEAFHSYLLRWVPKMNHFPASYSARLTCAEVSWNRNRYRVSLTLNKKRAPPEPGKRSRGRIRTRWLCIEDLSWVVEAVEIMETQTVRYKVLSRRDY